MLILQLVAVFVIGTLTVESQSINYDQFCNIQYGTSCYVLVTSQVSWYDARDHCVTYGGYLAGVNDDALRDLVIGLKNALNYNSGDVSIWLGGTDEAQEDTWTWVGSGNNVTYDDWKGSQPNGGTNSNCMATQTIIDDTGNVNDGWYDFKCSKEKIFLCEYSMV